MQTRMLRRLLLRVYAHADGTSWLVWQLCTHDDRESGRTVLLRRRAGCIVVEEQQRALLLRRFA